MPKDRPIIIKSCVLEIDLDRREPPVNECWRDRERSINPDLQKGMVCGVEFDVFQKGRKEIHRWSEVCRPMPKLFEEAEKVMDYLHFMLRPASVPKAKRPNEIDLTNLKPGDILKA